MVRMPGGLAGAALPKEPHLNRTVALLAVTQKHLTQPRGVILKLEYMPASVRRAAFDVNLALCSLSARTDGQAATISGGGFCCAIFAKKALAFVAIWSLVRSCLCVASDH